MKKEVIISIALLFIIYGLFSGYLLGYSPVLLSPGEDFTPPVPETCSDSSITAVWDVIFDISSVGTTIIANASDTDKCDAYYAYKINSESLYALGGIYGESDSNNVSQIIAMSGNLTDSAETALTSISENQVLAGWHMLELVSVISFSEEEANPRSIDTIQDAETEYLSVFEVENASAFYLDPGSNTYNFSYLEITTTSEKVTTGGVHAENNTVFLSSIYLFGDDCAPNWTEHQTDCTEDETNISYYEDENSCGDYSNYPGNETNDCDYDDDGVIGSESSIDDTNLDIVVYIDGDELNSTRDYNSTYEVKLKEGSTTRIEFDWSFDDAPLNFREMDIQKQSASSAYGYMIIQGIDAEKTVRIDKKNSSSSRICIKDRASVDSLSDISDDCSDSDEDLLDCPDTAGGFSCSISGDLIVVTGLDHSAVEEFLDGGNSSCTANWTCGAWGTCTNDEQTRTCTDSNSCQADRTETQACDSGCTPSWDCTTWSPEKCPKNKTQYRDCEDSNDCEDDKTESRSCEYKSMTLMIVMIVIAVLIALALVIFFTIMKSKGSEEPSQYTPTAVIRRPPTSFQAARPFGGGY